MGALACGTRALCAYPSYQRVTIFAPLIRISCTFGREVSETAKNLFLTINQLLAKRTLVATPL